MHKTTRRACGVLAGVLALAAPAAAQALTLATGTTASTVGDLLSIWVEDDTSTTSSEPATSETAATNGCPDDPLVKAFANWGDPALYKLVPGGDFETDGAGWTLAGGARVVDGGSPYAATGKAGRRTLLLPGGAVATSPLVCITPGSPVARLFASTQPGKGASLAVEILDEGGKAKPAGNLPEVTGWDAARRFSVGQGRLGAQQDGNAYMRIRLTAAPASSWQVDDVFVDPRSLR